MICNHCGSSLPDDAVFCNVCGNIVNSAASNGNHQQQYYKQPSNENGIFVDPNEKIVATLSNGMAQNVISGEGLKKERAIVTDKRLYYSIKKGVINITQIEQKIDIKDITGTNITGLNPVGLLIFAGILLIFAIILAVSTGEPELIPAFIMPAIALTVIYFVSFKKFFKIDYAGGNIRFSLRGYSMEKAREFQKSIYAVKDTLNK